MRRAGREAAERAMRQARHSAERLFADRVVALLEHEGADIAQTELAGRGAQRVERFLHGVADEDHDRDFAALVRAPRMRQTFADLGLAAAASEARIRSR